MRVVSGAQSSGTGLHLGNYFGAVRQWIALVDTAFGSGGDAFYFIADYHALNSVRDGAQLAHNTHEVACDYMALGLDPTRATLYRQSDVPEVCELAWVLSTVTPMGLLERCHAYKDKVAQGLPADHGLFAYPVLMAADILICRGDTVPVGDDQKQHVEVTRDIAIKFNAIYGDVLLPPEPYIVEGVRRVPGIDGRKMSRSYGNDVRIFDSEKDVRKRIMAIVTDSREVHEPKEPDGNVIYELYKLVAPADAAADMARRMRAGGLGYGDGKKMLFEAFLDRFRPMRERREHLARHPGEVEEALAAGARKARAVAQEMMERVRHATGLVRRVVRNTGKSNP